MKHRRMSLASAIFRLIFITTVVSIIAITAVIGINLNNGFSNYIKAREQAQLASFAAIVSDEIKASGQLKMFQANPGAMRRVIDRLTANRGPGAVPVEHGLPPAPLNNTPPPLDQPPPTEFDSADGPPPGRMPPTEFNPKNRPPPGGDFTRPKGFPGRVAIFSPDGQQITGFPFDTKSNFIEEPVLVDGRLVAIARLTLQVVPDSIEAQFLRKQFSLIALTSLILFALAAVASWQFARRMAQPLKEIQAATDAIASGDFSVVLKERSIDEMAKTVANINTMTAALQKLENNRRRWLAQIAHELRTPVTVLRGQLEAQMDGIHEFSPATLQSLHEEVLRLMAVIDDLHLVSMGDLGKVPCTIAAANAAEIGLRMRERFLPMAQKMGFDLQLNYDATIAVPLQCDVMRIEQVLANIITNSLRYTDSPSVIFLKIENVDNGVIFSLDDGPPGVKESDIEHLFEPLYRVDESRSRLTGGSGLGLAVCKAIVDAHEGSISAKPSIHGGLCVYFRLPFKGTKQ